MADETGVLTAAKAFVDIVPRPSLGGLGGMISAQLTEFEAGVAASTGAGIETRVATTAAGLSSLGSTLTKQVSVPLAGVAAAALASSESYDQGQRIIQQRTGETGAVLSGLKGVYDQVASSSQTASASFSQQAEVESNLHERLGLTGKALVDRSEQYLVLQRVAGDTAPSVDQVTRAMAAFNIPTAQQGTELDKLFVASQRSAVPMNQLLDLLVTGGPQLKAFGFSLDTAAQLLGVLGQAGVPATGVLTALRVAAGKAKDDGRPLSDFLKDTIAQLQQLHAEGKDTEAIDLGKSVFGQRGGLAFTQAIIEGRVNTDQLAAAMANAQGAIERTGKQTESLGLLFKQDLREGELALRPLGEELLPKVESGLGAVKTVAGATGTVLHDIHLDGLVADVVLLGAAVGPASKLAGVLGSAAQPALNLVRASNQWVSSLGASKAASAAATQADELEAAGKANLRHAEDMVIIAENHRATAAAATSAGIQGQVIAEEELVAAEQADVAATELDTIAQGQLAQARAAATAAADAEAASTGGLAGKLGTVGIAAVAGYEAYQLTSAGLDALDGWFKDSATSADSFERSLQKAGDTGQVDSSLKNITTDVSSLGGGLEGLAKKVEQAPNWQKAIAGLLAVPTFGLSIPVLGHLQADKDTQELKNFDAALADTVKTQGRKQATEDLQVALDSQGKTLSDVAGKLPLYEKALDSASAAERKHHDAAVASEDAAGRLGIVLDEQGNVVSTLTARQAGLAVAYRLSVNEAKAFEANVDGIASATRAAEQADQGVVSARRSLDSANADLALSTKHLSELTNGYAADSKEAKDATTAASEAEQSLADKRQAVVDAIQSERQAEESAQQAQYDWNKTVQDGIDKQRELARAVESADDKVHSAQENLEKLQARGADRHDIEDARTAVQRAQEDADDARRKQAEGPAEQAQAERQAADKIVSANQQVDKAKQGVAKASREADDAAQKAADAELKLSQILHGGSGTADELAAAQKDVADKTWAVQQASAALPQAEADAATAHQKLLDTMSVGNLTIQATIDKLLELGDILDAGYLAGEWARYASPAGSGAAPGLPGLPFNPFNPSKVVHDAFSGLGIPGFAGGTGDAGLPEGFSTIDEAGPELLHKSGPHVDVITAGRAKALLAPPGAGLSSEQGDRIIALLERHLDVARDTNRQGPARVVVTDRTRSIARSFPR